MAAKKSNNISVGPKLPVSFDQFVKNPVAAVAFCMLLAVGYLYMDQKSATEKVMDDCRAETRELKTMVFEMKDQVRRSDSISSAALSQINILKKLGKIPE
jgi:hypothetical protein